MNTKNLILIIISIFLIIALPVSALAVSGILNNSTSTDISTSSTKTVSNNTITSSATTSKVTSQAVSSVITTKTTSSTSKTTSTANTISISVVQQHNSDGDCYVAISGKVYNLSNFRHPSPDDWTVLCGMDITNSQHPRAAAFTSSKVLNQIASFYIGNFGN